MSKKDLELEVEAGEYRGSPTITVWEVEDGVRKQFPVISFGKKKAKAIIKVIEQIKQFSEE